METKYETPLYILGFMFFMAPLFMGFYSEPYIFAGIFIPLLLMGYSALTLRPRPGFKMHALDILVLILFLAYILSTFRAGDLHEAIITDLKLAGYFSLYFWIRLYRPVTNFVQQAGVFIYAGAVACSLVTWLNVLNILSIDAVYVDKIFQTTIGYKNTGALFLSLGFFLGMLIYSEYQGKVYGYLAAAGSALVFTAFLGTQSRAVWLLFIIQVILVAWLFKDDLRSIVVYCVSVIIPATVGMSVALIAIDKEQFFLALVVLCFTLILAVALCAGLEKMKLSIDSRQGKLVLGLVILLILVGFVLSVFLSHSSLARISAISLSDNNFKERIYMAKDAWKIISRNFWIGTGGQGWDAYYLNYQTYSYYAENIHNAYLQTWLEAGIVGFIAFVAAWVVVLYSGTRHILNKNSGAAGITKVLMLFSWVLAIHSIIDFDLSYGCISLIFWTFSGFIINQSQGFVETAKIKKRPGPKFVFFKYGVFAVCLVLALVTGSFAAARVYYDQSKQALEQGAVNEYISLLQKSLNLDPYNINTTVRLSQQFYQLADRGPGYLAQSISYGKWAVLIKPSEPMGHYVLSQAYIADGQTDAAVSELKQYVQHQPNLQKAYESLAEGYLIAAKRCLEAGDKTKAKEYLLGIKDTINQVQTRKKSIPSEVLSLWRDEPLSVDSPVLQNSWSEAQELLKTVSS